jgi:DNA-binding CsgD family transcriptional regulator
MHNSNSIHLDDSDCQRLVAIIDAPWQSRIVHAECEGLPNSWFAPEDGVPPHPAVFDACGSCAESLKCLAFQLRNECEGERPWVWYGGCGPDERSEIAVRIRRVVHPLSAAQERRQIVARLAALGRTQHEIADELGVDRKTVQRDLAQLRSETA